MTQPTRTTWATTADVLSLTGTTDVTDEELVQANAIIEIIEGRVYTLAAARTGDRDAEWLRRAVAYQVPWMRAQPDFFQRLDVTTLENVGALRDLTLICPPMARLAINRLSWRRTRSVRIRSAFTDGAPASINPLAEANDAYEQWSPIGSR